MVKHIYSFQKELFQECHTCMKMNGRDFTGTRTIMGGITQQLLTMVKILAQLDAFDRPLQLLSAQILTHLAR